MTTACAAGSAVATTTQPEASARSDSLTESDRVAKEAQCLQDHGVEAWSDGIFLIVNEGPDDQADAVEKIMAQCSEETESQFPREPIRDYSSIEAKTELYENMVTTWRCLSAEGYENESPPTVDAWLESWTTGPWNPYFHLVKQVDAEAEWKRINETCPQPANTVVRLWDPISVQP